MSLSESIRSISRNLMLYKQVTDHVAIEDTENCLSFYGRGRVPPDIIGRKRHSVPCQLPKHMGIMEYVFSEDALTSVFDVH